MADPRIENLLITFRNVRGAVFDGAAVAAGDLAAALGCEPERATMRLGRALESPAEAEPVLRRAGVVFTKRQRKQIKRLTRTRWVRKSKRPGRLVAAQKLILAEVEKEFGGASSATI